jgi:hypothetical protein
MGLFLFHTQELVKVHTWKLLADLLSHLATKMSHLAPFEGSSSKKNGAHFDVYFTSFPSYISMGWNLV